MDSITKYFIFRDFGIPIIIIVIFIFIFIVSLVIELFNKLFKKNCYDCKYYKLDDVAGCGDACWYKCSKNNRIDRTTMNQREHYEKCKKFKGSE